MLKVGVLVLSVGLQYGQKGLYNLQEVGLAKELARNGHEVLVYKCIQKSEKKKSEMLENGIVLNYQPTKRVGNHSIFNTSCLDKSIDVLVCLCDNQISTPMVYRWAMRNKILFIPYIGCFESTSPSALKRTIMNLLAKPIYSVFRKTSLLVKTNAVRIVMERKGIHDVAVAPVGLDFDLMFKDFHHVNLEELRNKWGFESNDKIVLMVGRIESDRNPLDCIDVFKNLQNTSNSYRFLIVGNGSMKNELQEKLLHNGLLEATRFETQVPNCDMWELYCISELLVSFSHTEIFGMSILEAMYYERPVFALHAPGPDDIIENGVSGFLFDTSEQMAGKFHLMNTNGIGQAAHERVINDFSWKNTCREVEKVIFRT